MLSEKDQARFISQPTYVNNGKKLSEKKIWMLSTMLMKTNCFLNFAR